MSLQPWAGINTKRVLLRLNYRDNLECWVAEKENSPHIPGWNSTLPAALVCRQCRIQERFLRGFAWADIFVNRGRIKPTTASPERQAVPGRSLLARKDASPSVQAKSPALCSKKQEYTVLLCLFEKGYRQTLQFVRLY